MTLSVDLINLLEQFTKLRKIFYLLDYSLIVKDVTQSDGRDMRKGSELPCPLQAWRHSKSFPFGLLWRLHYISTLD